MKKQPWLQSPIFDLLFIISPPFWCLLLIALFPGFFAGQNKISDFGWLILVLFVDVGHVYSTLYRTYFDPVMWQQKRSLLLAIPLTCFALSVMAYSVAPSLFWHAIAYLAVFHFVRQQYGFVRVYSRKENLPAWSRRLDNLCIYAATIYPLIYWHLKGPRNFNWFVDGDFWYLTYEKAIPWFFAGYCVLLVAWLLKEVYFLWQSHYFNLPKWGIMSGSALSWYFGIVYFNGDMAFTLLNVISHGIPYMALIWWYGHKNYPSNNRYPKWLRLLFNTRGIVIFIGFLLLLAYVEEGLWDVSLWKEHDRIFGFTDNWRVNISGPLLTLVVGLLSIPQMTHYILDGFIWHRKAFDTKT